MFLNNIYNMTEDINIKIIYNEEEENINIKI